MNLERELSAALRRREPPADFASRVAEAAKRPEARRAVGGRAWRIVAIAAILALLVVAGANIQRRIHEERRIAEGEQAKAQVMAALRITSHKLSTVKSTLNGRANETGAFARTQSGT